MGSSVHPRIVLDHNIFFLLYLIYGKKRSTCTTFIFNEYIDLHFIPLLRRRTRL